MPHAHGVRLSAPAPCGMASRTAWNPARHGIPRGTVSHAARYRMRHGIASKCADLPLLLASTVAVPGLRRPPYRQVGMLSGGERNRCHLAKMVKRGNNLIMVRRRCEGTASPLGSLVGLRWLHARKFARTHFVRKAKRRSNAARMPLRPYRLAKRGLSGAAVAAYKARSVAWLHTGSTRHAGTASHRQCGSGRRVRSLTNRRTTWTWKCCVGWSR